MTALWMVMDGVTILASTLLVTFYEKHTGPVAGAMRLWRNTLDQKPFDDAFAGRALRVYRLALDYKPTDEFIFASSLEQH